MQNTLSLARACDLFLVWFQSIPLFNHWKFAHDYQRDSSILTVYCKINHQPKKDILGGVPMFSKIFAALILLISLSACSSIIEGTSQEILVNTNPAGANCSLMREGVSIARINPTPGAATIKKTKHDITIECTKSGYSDVAYLNHSDVAGATVGNVLLGGGIGWAIDSASGADNKYESPVNITLVPEVAASSADTALPPEPK
ncbi:hypothetical protein [uncultured Parvibaculum sp.]|uniref:hypothetical protein n=2 Tax=Parvibaculum TaxID=256616 RepID=UPI0030DCEAE6